MTAIVITKVWISVPVTTTFFLAGLQSMDREQIDAALYLNNPYGKPVIGWRHEMEELSRDDAIGFYRRFYAPNNAVVVVAGIAASGIALKTNSATRSVPTLRLQKWTPKGPRAWPRPSCPRPARASGSRRAPNVKCQTPMASSRHEHGFSSLAAPATEPRRCTASNC